IVISAGLVPIPCVAGACGPAHVPSVQAQTKVGARGRHKVWCIRGAFPRVTS
ncbi:uncharacterized protein SCHCODRAFT_02628134, partial [Schizophyllum commune H4-8]|uniref:uncharacterized protein n=1 Tax=Schizophyllum commune (strain H4-8 / FGSC 9210) TaxID=578458 RepID=UPI0021609FD3